MVMDTTITINPGSASKKYALYQGESLVLTVLFERTGDGFGRCVEVNGTRQHCEATTPTAYETSLREVLEIALREGVITAYSEITRVGLRVVAPGSYFTEHRVIDGVFEERLKALTESAPLHIPPVIEEFEQAKSHIPNVRVIGVSDSEFHRTIPSYARTYSIPSDDTKRYDVYRFGYHGLSVGSVVGEVKTLLGRIPDRMVVCHIGSGVSVTALKQGVSVDTTMGFTPASGLMMGTRAGDIDPGALFHILRKKGIGGKEAEHYVNESGGLKGILGQSDLRIALDRMARGEQEAIEAVRMYMYRIQKAISAYGATLGGFDALIFTATAAERNPLVRSLVCDGLQGLRMTLDQHRNEETLGRSGILSPEGSEVTIAVVNTNEMREIARITNSF